MDHLVATARLALVCSISPRPVDLVALNTGASSGAHAGHRHVIGATIGCVALLLLLGMGLQHVLLRWPPLGRALHLHAHVHCDSAPLRDRPHPPNHYWCVCGAEPKHAAVDHMASFDEGQCRVAPELLPAVDGHLRIACRLGLLHGGKMIAPQHSSALHPPTAALMNIRRATSPEWVAVTVRIGQAPRSLVSGTSNAP